MSGHKCTKELYKVFLQASSVRYSGLALSEVSPSALSHDSISRYVDKRKANLLIADDMVLSKRHSKKI